MRSSRGREKNLKQVPLSTEPDTGLAQAGLDHHP